MVVTALKKSALIGTVSLQIRNRAVPQKSVYDPRKEWKIPDEKNENITIQNRILNSTKMTNNLFINYKIYVFNSCAKFMQSLSLFSISNHQYD